MTGELPIIVSYYTVSTPYEAMAGRLLDSCERHGLEHYIMALPSLGSWEANNAAKASVCQIAWQQLGQPILWVDADAIMHRPPELLRGATADFGVHKWKGRYFAGGTLFFNQTSMAERLLDGWVTRCADVSLLDQVHLELEWNALVQGHPIETVWLPRAYCQIFDATREGDASPVVEHFQASRTERPKALEVVH